MKRSRFWLACIACGLLGISLAGCTADSGITPSLPSGSANWEKIGEISEGGTFTTMYRIKAADGVEYVVTRCHDGVSVIPAPPRKTAEQK